jgi:hypothetical protein
MPLSNTVLAGLWFMRREKSTKFKTQKIMKTLKVLFLCSAAFLLTLMQSPAEGTLLEQYAAEGVPDLSAVSLNASFNQGTHAFNIPTNGALMGYVDSAGTSWGIVGTPIFIVTANIDSFGYLSSGSFSAAGDLYELGQQTLLTGNLVVGPQGSPAGSAPVGSAYDYTSVVAFEDGGYMSLIDFTFNVTGGALAGDFGGVGSSAIISFSSWEESGPIGDWTMSWSNEGGGMCDVFPIPEPTTAGCFLLGLGALACFRRFAKTDVR